MKVLVTGANGLLGNKLAYQLLKNQTIELFLTGKGPCRDESLKPHYYACELTRKGEVNSLFEWAQPDYVIHAAAMTQVDECELQQATCWDINVKATLFLIGASKQYKSVFQYISTDFVFDGIEGNYLETDRPSPLNYYGATKWAAEKLVRQSGLKWVIVRTVLVYGYSPNLSRSNLVLWVKQSLEKNKQINVVTDQVRTPTLVEDLARGCSLILQKKASGIFHLCGEEVMTPFEMALQVADHFGLDKGLISPVDAGTFTQPGMRPPKTGLRIDKARKVLEFQPSSFYQGLSLIESQIT